MRTSPVSATSDRTVWRILVVGLLVVVAVGRQDPAWACVCGEVEPAALVERVRDGEVVVQGRQLGPAGPGHIEVAVEEAVGADVGPRISVPALLPVTEVDSDGEQVTASTSCDYAAAPGRQVTFVVGDTLDSCNAQQPFEALEALTVPPPPPLPGPVRFLARAPDPYDGTAGYGEDAVFRGLIELEPDRIVWCPGGTTGIVLQGDQLYDGTNGETWLRLDAVTLTAEPLVRRHAVNGIPTTNPNILTDVVCLDPEGRDLLALFTFFEPPNVEPQLLVRVVDGEPRELLRAPIWNVWAHEGEVYARVDRDGQRIVRLDVDTVALSQVGTLPADLRFDDGSTVHVARLEVAAGGAWGVLGVGSHDHRDLVRVAFPSGAPTAIAAPAPAFGWARPLADGRLALASRDAPLQLLDEALQPLTGASLPLTAGLVSDAPDGAWFDGAEGTYRLPRDGQPPATIPLHATAVLPQPSTAELQAPAPEPIPTFTYGPVPTTVGPVPTTAGPVPTTASPVPTSRTTPAATASATPSVPATGSADRGSSAGTLAIALGVVAAVSLAAAFGRRARATRP